MKNEFTTEQKLEAKKLFLSMYEAQDPLGKYPMCFDTAKQCTIIAINIIINQLLELPKEFEKSRLYFYWVGVEKYVKTITKESLENE